MKVIVATMLTKGCLGIGVLLVLACKKLFWRDLLFSSYLCWFVLSGFVLTLLGVPGNPAFLLVGPLLYIVGLLLACVLVARLNPPAHVPLIWSAVGCAAVFMLRRDLPLAAALYFGACVWVLLYCLIGSLFAREHCSLPFEKRQLNVLRVLWGAQASTFLSMWLFATRQTVLYIETVNATVMAVAVAWALLQFLTIQPESSRQPESNPALFEGPAVLRPEIALARARRDNAK